MYIEATYELSRGRALAMQVGRSCRDNTMLLPTQRAYATNSATRNEAAGYLS